MKYPMVYLKGQDGWIIAFSPDFPEAMTQGADIEEAIEMSLDIMKICFTAYIEEGRSFPKASTAEEAKQEIARQLEEDAGRQVAEEDLVVKFIEIDIDAKPLPEDELLTGISFLPSAWLRDSAPTKTKAWRSRRPHPGIVKAGRLAQNRAV